MASESVDWKKNWPYLPFCDSTVLERCKSYPATDEVYICSFPKSGTTWMQNMVYSILMKGQNRDFGQMSDVVPFYEHRRTWAETAKGEPPSLTAEILKRTEHMPRRAFNTHCLWKFLPKGSPNTRFLYVVRQGEDAMVSFFHHLTHQKEGGYEGDFKSFFEDSMAGTTAFGRWTDHLKSWLPQAKRDKRILVVTYEEMKVDLGGVLLKVAKHLDVALMPEEAESLLKLLTFEAMQGSAQFQPTSVPWKEGYAFVRKGIVGDFKNHFQGDMEARFLRAACDSRALRALDPWARAAKPEVCGCGGRYLRGPLRKPTWRKVKDVKPGVKGLNLLLTVVTCRGDKDAGAQEVAAGDETGVLTLLVDTQGVEARFQASAAIRVQNARVVMRDGFIRVLVDKWGVCKAVEEAHAFEVNTNVDVSALKWTAVDAESASRALPQWKLAS